MTLRAPEVIKMERQSFYRPEEILEEVGQKVEASERLGQTIDYLTFVA